MAKILLVEDDQMISKMMVLRLMMRGHQVDTAINGQQGVDRALAGNYDLILMDMHMPVLDGHGATRQLRDQGYQGLIVAVTASAMSSDSRKALDSGCDAHIVKPITADFEDQIEAILQQAND